MDLLGDQSGNQGQAYRVLARAYRPTKLSELIGQDILVRALTNAFSSGRVAHAFLLSGIRGVGKTTTARIIARALNCTGSDGRGGPTPEPCGVCSSCTSIASDSALDVIEMDAATHTGINDIREIVESIPFAPASSRFKIYIIDEVHMLSINAFNGLLKTLEEPPPHAKFIFATTEARKVPITVLSRCQRFDLRRVDIPVLQAHLGSICSKEALVAEPEALALIARAAEGSVRDSLSLLDQAIALSDGKVRRGEVASMLGYGRKSDMLALLRMLLEGQGGPCVERVRQLYADGSEPAAMIQDLLELTHELSTLKAGAQLGALDEEAQELAGGHGLERLSRFWQMLLKGLDEIRQAPHPLPAMEMLSLRLAFASSMPPPGELMTLLAKSGGSQAPAPHSSPSGRSHPPSATGGQARAAAPVPTQLPAPPQSDPDASDLPASFEAMIALLQARKEPVLAASLEQSVHLISYQPPRLNVRLSPTLPADFSGKLGNALAKATGQRWIISLEREGGDDTVASRRQAKKQRLMSEFAELPEIKRVLDAIPGARIIDVRDRTDHKPQS